MTFEEWWEENYSDVIALGVKEIALAAWKATQPQWQPIETWIGSLTTRGLPMAKI